VGELRIVQFVNRMSRKSPFDSVPSFKAEAALSRTQCSTTNILARVRLSGLQHDAVVAGADIAAGDPHVAAGIRVYAVGVQAAVVVADNHLSIRTFSQPLRCRVHESLLRMVTSRMVTSRQFLEEQDARAELWGVPVHPSDCRNRPCPGRD